MGRIIAYIQSILRKSEKIFKTDMVYLAHGGLWITIGRGIAAVSGFLLTLVLANFVTKETLGTYKFIQSIAGVILAFSLTGMGTAVTQAVAQGNDGAVREGFRTFLKWSTIMTLVAIGTAIYYFAKDNSVIGWSLIIIAIALPFSQAGGFFSPFLVGKKEFREETRYGILYTILPALATALAAFMTHSALALIAASFCTTAIVTMVIYSRVIRKYNPQKIGSIAKTLSYGKHLSLMNILGTISFQLDRILVFHFLGAAQLAIYSIAMAPPQQIRYLNKVLSTLALPKFATADVKILKQTLHRKALILFCAAIILAGLYIIAAPLIFHIFFSQYSNAIPYSQGYAVLILFFPALLYQQALTAHMDHRSLYVIQVGGPTIKIILFGILFFFLHWGIWGIIISLLSTEVLRFGYVLYAFNKLSTVPQALPRISNNSSQRTSNTLSNLE